MFVFSKRDEKVIRSSSFFKAFCRIGYFPAKLYEIPLVLFSSSCAPFSGLLSLECECAHYTTGVGLFSLIFLKRKGATVSKVLEKRESIVFCYIINVVLSCWIC